MEQFIIKHVSFVVSINVSNEEMYSADENERIIIAISPNSLTSFSIICQK